MRRNTDVFKPWNNPIYKNDVFAPWNNVMKKDSPFACWNNIFGHGNYEKDVDEYMRRRR